MAEAAQWPAGLRSQITCPTLAAALEQVELGGQPEDAARGSGNHEVLQSMDGFPAPQVTPGCGCLTAPHACSDWGLRCNSFQRHGNDHTSDGHGQ